MNRPNIIEIIWHDLGRHLHCYGWESTRSPHLDLLAGEGVLFDNAFCTAPLCSPSRGSIVTGRYPHCNGLMGLVHRGWRFKAGERFLPQLLRQAGYRTLLFGKQHEVPRGQESTLGYEAACAVGSDAPKVAAAFAHWAARESRKRTPFFASIGFRQVHRPHAAGRYAGGAPAEVQVPPFLPDLPAVREDLAGYEALIETADAAVGEILAALDRAGVAQDTLVLFTTDHGTDLPRAKSSLYDPGIGVAMIMRLPGIIPAPRRLSHLISNVDILPTLLEAAGAPAPENVQGRSFWPLLTGAHYEPRSEIFAERTWHATYDPMRCLRTERHKLIRNFRPGRPLLAPPEFIKRVGVDAVEQHFGHPRPEYELYDLERDPHEMDNLAGRRECAEMEAQLKERLQRSLQSTDDPILRGDIPHPGRHSDVWDWREDDGRWRLYDPKTEG